MRNINRRLFFYSFVFTIILFSSVSYSDKEDKTFSIVENEKKVKEVLDDFISSCRRKDFNRAYHYTTGKEKRIYASIIEGIKIRNGSLPPEIKAYFQRLKDFKVDIVEVDKSLEKAVAICTFQFRYYDTKSYDEVRKYREVFYYLSKVGKEWKITYSKLKNEHYYYKSKSNGKLFRKY